MAYQKAQVHKSKLEELNEQIEEHKVEVRRETVKMPDLLLSPFLPMSQQVQQVSQPENLEQTLQTNSKGFGEPSAMFSIRSGPDDSL